MPRPRSPLLLFALTGVLSVPFWVLGAWTGGTLPGVGVSVSIGMVVAPALAAMALAYREGGREAVRRLWSRVGRAARPVAAGVRHRWWVLAVGLLPALTVLSWGLAAQRGAGIPDLRAALPAAAVLALPLLALAALEEIAWTGYATDPLRARWGMFGASVVMGSLWAAWHLLPWLQVHDVRWVCWQALFTVALRVVIVGAYHALGGSLAAAIVIHAMSNVGFVATGDRYDPAPMALLISAVAVAVLLNPRCHQPVQPG